MIAVVERTMLRIRTIWASDRVRLVGLTVYYLAIIVGLVMVRNAHLPATRFVYQGF
jgi:hypothetical protein